MKIQSIDIGDGSRQSWCAFLRALRTLECPFRAFKDVDGAGSAGGNFAEKVEVDLSEQDFEVVRGMATETATSVVMRHRLDPDRIHLNDATRAILPAVFAALERHAGFEANELFLLLSEVLVADQHYWQKNPGEKDNGACSDQARYPLLLTKDFLLDKGEQARAVAGKISTVLARR